MNRKLLFMGAALTYCICIINVMKNFMPYFILKVWSFEYWYNFIASPIMIILITIALVKNNQDNKMDEIEEYNKKSYKLFTAVGNLVLIDGIIQFVCYYFILILVVALGIKKDGDSRRLIQMELITFLALSVHVIVFVMSIKAHQLNPNEFDFSEKKEKLLKGSYLDYFKE